MTATANNKQTNKQTNHGPQIQFPPRTIMAEKLNDTTKM